MYAASKGHTDIAQLLLDKGADINVATEDGWTPLKVAISEGHSSTATLLSKARAAQ
jgi:ankyrin repeat protein